MTKRALLHSVHRTHTHTRLCMLGTQTWCLFNRSICGRPSPHSWRVSPVEPQTFSFQFWLPAYLRHTSYRLVLFSLTSPIHPPTLQHTERPSSWGTPCRANTGAWRAQRLGKQLLSFPLRAHSRCRGRNKCREDPALCHGTIYSSNPRATMQTAEEHDTQECSVR